MDDLCINQPVQWDQEQEEELDCTCVLCENADDTGSALGYLKQLDTALGGRTKDGVLAKMQMESYEMFFAQPMRDKGMDVPELTEEMIRVHFTHHDINPLRILRHDINRLDAIQMALRPRKRGAGGMLCNENDAKQWREMQRLKMDLVRQYEQTDARTSKDMPAVPTV